MKHRPKKNPTDCGMDLPPWTYNIQQNMTAAAERKDLVGGLYSRNDLLDKHRAWNENNEELLFRARSFEFVPKLNWNIADAHLMQWLVLLSLLPEELLLSIM